MPTWKAKVIDSTHLELTSPISIPKGKTVLLFIEGQADADEERAQWLTESLQGLNAAYSHDEPDYRAEMIREPNAEYATPAF